MYFVGFECQSDRHVLAGLTGPLGQVTRSAFFKRCVFLVLGGSCVERSDRHVLTGLTGPPGHVTRSGFSREGVFEVWVFSRSGSTGLWLPVVPHVGVTACERYGISREDVVGDFGISPRCGMTAMR